MCSAPNTPQTAIIYIHNSRESGGFYPPLANCRLPHFSVAEASGMKHMIFQKMLACSLIVRHGRPRPLKKRLKNQPVSTKLSKNP